MNITGIELHIQYGMSIECPSIRFAFDNEKGIFSFIHPTSCIDCSFPAKIIANEKKLKSCHSLNSHPHWTGSDNSTEKAETTQLNYSILIESNLSQSH